MGINEQRTCRKTKCPGIRCPVCGQYTLWQYIENRARKTNWIVAIRNREINGLSITIKNGPFCKNCKKIIPISSFHKNYHCYFMK